MSTLLEVKGLNKSFAVPVLTNLDFQLEAGEIHALMGSNGAGKSTLCNIIAGIHAPTTGTLLLDGKPHNPKSIKEAEQSGIQMVMQELNLFPTLSIAENLCFKSLIGSSDGLRKTIGVIDKTNLHQKASRMLEVLNLSDLDPAMPVSELGVGQQQLIEIAGIISNQVKLLILDEPTAALTDPQIDQLFSQLNRLRDQGVGIIYISHRMDEIARIADRVSVLRDGKLVATVASDQINPDQLVSLMAGQKYELTEPEPPANQSNQAFEPTDELTNNAYKPALKIENLGRSGKFEQISLDVHFGEVLGIGGLIGAGRTELLRAIFGADIADSGGIRLSADEFSELKRLRSPSEAIASGIGMVVEDRKGQGLLLSGSIASNISLCKLADLTGKAGVMDEPAEQLLSENISESLAIKYDRLGQPISELSGGNQQKALIGRWLAKDLPVLLFDEPSRGVDARAKARIQQLIREQAASGKAVILVSSETQELMEVSDRIAVLSNGRLAGQFNPSETSEEQLLEASFKFYTREAAV